MYKNKISILVFVLLLAISLMACSIGGSKATEVPTSPPKATEATSKSLRKRPPSPLQRPISNPGDPNC